VVKSIRNSVRFSACCFSRGWPVSGNKSAAHAFRLQASEAIAIYAQLLSRLSTGAASERADAAFELLQQIFLIAAVVGRKVDLLGWRFLVIRDIEETPRIVEELLLPATDFQILSHHDDAIGPATLGRLVRKLGHVFLHQVDVFEFPLAHDLLLDVFRTAARTRFHGVFSRSFQLLPGVFWQVFHDFIKIRHGIDAEDKLHVAGVVRAVQMRRLREIGVAAEEFILETRPAAEGDGPIELNRGVFVAGAVAGTVYHIQRFGGVGQREQQRVVAPLALMIDVHALLALARGLDHRAVGLDNRLLEKRLRLLSPDLQPRSVEDLHQADDVVYLEAAAEVAHRGRVGNATRPTRRGTLRRFADIPNAPSTRRPPIDCRRC
jgi:hypothetical protein